MTKQTQSQTQKHGDVPSATQTGAAAPKMGPRKDAPGRDIVLAVLAYCTAHSIPEPDRIARSALGQQTKNLLAGGYDPRDIRETAIELASRYTLYVRHKALMTLQSVIVQKYADQAYREHEDQLEREKDPVSPEVAALMPHLRGIGHRGAGWWSKRCEDKACSRPAIYGRANCSDHDDGRTADPAAHVGRPSRCSGCGLLGVEVQRKGARTYCAECAADFDREAEVSAAIGAPLRRIG